MADRLPESILRAFKRDARENAEAKDAIEHIAKLLNENHQEEALDKLTQIVTLPIALPSMMLAKAIVEAKLGQPIQALQTVSTLLVEDPDHLGGKQLLSEIHRMIQYDVGQIR